MGFEIKIVLVAMFFVILISLQYTLNKILVILKEIRAILLARKDK
ncbi:MAG: hypothetical protein AAGU76_14585 [Sedimentibacter sp.]